MTLILDEHFPAKLDVVEEGSQKKPKGVLMTVKGPFGLTEKQNKNGRIYTNGLWKRVLESNDVQQRLNDRALYGEADHPTTLHPSLNRISHIVTKLWLDDKTNEIFGEAEVIDTPPGRIIKAIYDAKGRLGMSSRGAGGMRKEGTKEFVNEDEYKFGGFDFVVEPSCDNAYPDALPEGFKALGVAVGNILTESIDEVDREEPFYRTILEKVFPNGAVKLERDSEGNLLVLHNNQNLMEKTEDTPIIPEKTDDKETESPQEGVVDVYRRQVDFLECRLRDLMSAYKCLRESGSNPPAEVKEAENNDDLIAENEKLSVGIEERESLIAELTERIDTDSTAFTETINSCKRELEEAKRKIDVLEEKRTSQVTILKDEMTDITKKLKVSINENLNLYLRYQCSEKSVDPKKVREMLTESPKKSDIDVAVNVLVERRSSQTPDLPTFTESFGDDLTSFKNVSVKSGNGTNKTRKRVASLLGRI